MAIASNAVVIRPVRVLPVDIGFEVGVGATNTAAPISFSHGMFPSNVAGSHMVEGITCPQLDMRPLVTSTEEDWLFVPGGDGSTVRMSELTSSLGTRTMSYPGNASIQLAAYYDDQDGGLTLRSEDIGGETKELVYGTTFNSGALSSVSLAWRHELSSVIANQASFTPYTTVVGTLWHELDGCS